MSIGERIYTLRKNLNLTLEKFGEKVGLKKSTLSNIESNRYDTTDQTIRSICREFRVNESWLRNGEGEMFAPTTAEDEIKSMLSGIEEGSFKQRFVSMLAGLSEKEWEVLEKMALALAGSQPGPAEDDIESKVERYRASLEAEKRRASPASSGGGSSTGESEGIA